MMCHRMGHMRAVDSKFDISVVCSWLSSLRIRQIQNYLWTPSGRSLCRTNSFYGFVAALPLLHFTLITRIYYEGREKLYMHVCKYWSCDYCYVAEGHFPNNFLRRFRIQAQNWHITSGCAIFALFEVI